MAYRGADSYIQPKQLPDEVLQKTRIFHTTCFALSGQPARNTILDAARRAHDFGCQVSIDLNYSEKIWPEIEEALEAIQTYCSFQPLVKISRDDVDRLLGKGISHDDVFSYFHNQGARLVCFTLGKEGAKLSVKGNDVISLSALKVEKIMDATGAGDAFWSGFLLPTSKTAPENAWNLPFKWPQLNYKM